MATAAIERMSWEERHRTLQELCDANTRVRERCKSPAWHEQELEEAQAHLEHYFETEVRLSR